jgi:hypothetical protein
MPANVPRRHAASDPGASRPASLIETIGGVWDSLGRLRSFCSAPTDVVESESIAPAATIMLARAGNQHPGPPGHVHLGAAPNRSPRMGGKIQVLHPCKGRLLCPPPPPGRGGSPRAQQLCGYVPGKGGRFVKARRRGARRPTCVLALLGDARSLRRNSRGLDCSQSEVAAGDPSAGTEGPGRCHHGQGVSYLHGKRRRRRHPR